LNIEKKNYNKMFGAQNWAPYFYEIKLIRVMKKTVQIITIPLNKQTNFGIFKDVEDGEIIFTETSIKDNPYWQAQQLLVLSDDEIQEGDTAYYDTGNIQPCNSELWGKKDAARCELDRKAYGDCKKILASYPQIGGTLPISKETVQAWINSGKPGEGNVEIDDTIYCSVVKGKVKYGDPTKLDHQGNLLLEFGKKYKSTGNDLGDLAERAIDKIIANATTIPSIPTDVEIERKAHNNYTYGYLMPIGSHDRSRYEEKKESYTSGYKQALKDLGHE
jgi:hypothetical protein